MTVSDPDVPAQRDSNDSEQERELEELEIDFTDIKSEETLQRIRLAALLSKYAYVLGKPTTALTVLGESDAAHALIKEHLDISIMRPLPDAQTTRTRENIVFATLLETVLNAQKLPEETIRLLRFQRMWSRSWIYPTAEDQPRWLRSEAFIAVDEVTTSVLNQRPKRRTRIILGFRGTALDFKNLFRRSGLRDVRGETRPGFWPTVLGTIFYYFPLPAGLAAADVFHDLMIIRSPYHSGPVPRGLLSLWHFMKATARIFFFGLIFPLYAIYWLIVALRVWWTGVETRDSGEGSAHTGFWALWNAPEGFGGYEFDQFGRPALFKDGALALVKSTLEEAERKGKEAEVLVIGHSLGGAVSAFAALDIARRMNPPESHSQYFSAQSADPNVDSPTKRLLSPEGEELQLDDGRLPSFPIRHTTFAAPQVGTKLFLDTFERAFAPDGCESLALARPRDPIPGVPRPRWLDWLSPLGFGVSWWQSGRRVVLRGGPWWEALLGLPQHPLAGYVKLVGADKESAAVFSIV